MVGGVVLSASKAMKVPIPRFETEELVSTYSRAQLPQGGRPG